MNSHAHVDAPGHRSANVPQLHQTLWFQAAALALAISLFNVFSVAVQSSARVYPLDLDGWGYLITRLRNRLALGDLFHTPSLWKGPVVPFVFGLVYYFFPFETSPLVFNALLGGAAAGALYYCFVSFGCGRLPVAAALVAASLFPPHRFVLAYYYAEPLLAALLAVLVIVVLVAVRRRSVPLCACAGLVGGVIILSRPPYLLLVLVFAAWLWRHMAERHAKAVALYVLLVLVVWSPWPVRNYVVHHAFIPFTTEGGQIVFMSFYLPADDGMTPTFHNIPEFRELERRARQMDPVKQYEFWKDLAIQQVIDDPWGQVRLSVRKALRFWVYMPEHTWRPTFRTLVSALIYLPLAAIGFVRNRRLLVAQVCAVTVLSIYAVHVVLHSELRYNYPTLPYVFVLAALGVHWMIERVRNIGPGRNPVARPSAETTWR